MNNQQANKINSGVRVSRLNKFRVYPLESVGTIGSKPISTHKTMDAAFKAGLALGRNVYISAHESDRKPIIIVDGVVNDRQFQGGIK